MIIAVEVIRNPGEKRGIIQFFSSWPFYSDTFAYFARAYQRNSLEYTGIK